jgi:IPT/TIG domain
MRPSLSWSQFRLWALVIALAVLFVLVLVATVPFLPANSVSAWARAYLPLILALFAVLAVFGCALLVQGKKDFLLLFQSEGDKKLSVSKLQLYIWTSVIAFSYVYIVTWNYSTWAAQMSSQKAIPAPLEFPWTVLLALGLSVGTFGLAKGTAVSYSGGGNASNQPHSRVAAADGGAATQTTAMTPGLVASDVSGTPDITKVQMLAWTLIAAVVYIVDTVAQIDCTGCKDATGLITSLPPIDQALLVLTGVAQGTYIGNKLIVPRGAVLTAVSPAVVAPGGTAHVYGSGFGTAGSLLVDGTAATTAAWTDTDVTFTVPANKPNAGGPYTTGDKATLSMIVSGTPSANNLTLQF